VAVQELGEVGDDDVGAVLAQRVGLAHAVDAHDVSEPARAARLHAGQRVLEHGRARRVDAEPPRAGGERVRRGLALQPLARGHDAIDDLLEQLDDPGRPQDVAAVRARGHDGAAQARVAGGLDVAHRAVVPLDPVVLDEGEHQLVLAVAEAVDGARVGRVLRRAGGQVDPARGQERRHAVVARLAVHVAVVVRARVELAEGLAGLLRALAQELVEHLLPRGGVDLGGLRQHAVEVEQAGRDPVGQAEHPASVPGHAGASACHGSDPLRMVAM
jgi:hypothetical protein